jgi:hypothetical protein
MTPSEQEALLVRLTELAEYFDKPQSDAQLLLYIRALNDLPLEQVLAATNTVIQTCTFFPKVAEIRELVQGNDSDSAELAWMGLLREIRREGYTGRPKLPAATVETIRGLWGDWVNLCQTLPNDGPELLGWAKRFNTAYVATKHRIERPELIGRDEAAGLLNGITQRLGSGQKALTGQVSPVREGAEDPQRDRRARVESP